MAKNTVFTLLIFREDPDCVFPFTYGGEEYSTCITNDNYGIYWCGTDSDVDTNEKEWRLCDE